MMELIKEIFLQNAFASLKSAVVILLLIILTKPITRIYTAGFRYYSWLAVMIVFLIPFSKFGMNYNVNIVPSVSNIQIQDFKNWYDENAPTYSLEEKYTSYERIENDNKTEYVPVVKTQTIKKQVDIQAILSVIWLIGAITYFMLHYGRYIYFKRSIKRLSVSVNDERILNILNEECAKLKIAKPIKIRLAYIIDTPMLIGLVKPYIILPRLDYKNDELKLILRHEMFHFKRFDILYQLITLIFVSLHWFNPIVHIMSKIIEVDGETSCDEKTLEGKNYSEKIFYGEMLIKFLKTETQKKSYMTTTFFGGKNGMKKRLTLITNKKSRRKGTVAMAAVIMIAATTSFGAAAMDNEYFNTIFDGDTSYLADFVQTEKKSVEDNRFKFTLEQYLIVENQAIIICLFEAKTDDAVKEMNEVDERGNSTFAGIDFINFAPTDFSKASPIGYSVGSLDRQKFDTQNKKYYVLKCNDIQNEEKVDFYISTDRIKNSPKILIPMECNMETYTIQFDGITLKYNPISMNINYTDKIQDKYDDCSWNNQYLYFRMKNGEIKTFNQLYEYDGMGENSVSAWADSVIKPDEIKSVIVDDKEYPVDNPSNSKSIVIDEHLKPFKTKAYIKGHLWLPLRDFCNRIGAEIEWNSQTNSAEVKYRGSNYVFTVGSTKVQIDGEIVDFYDKLNDNKTFIDQNGQMFITPMIYDYMNIDIHVDNTYNQDGSVKDVMMHVVP